ncbi:Sorting nexin, cytoplasm-to-vacuole targeting pathway/endosomal sorting [Thecaphora frezii]
MSDASPSIDPFQLPDDGGEQSASGRHPSSSSDGTGDSNPSRTQHAQPEAEIEHRFANDLRLHHASERQQPVDAAQADDAPAGGFAQPVSSSASSALSLEPSHDAAVSHSYDQDRTTLAPSAQQSAPNKSSNALSPSIIEIVDAQKSSDGASSFIAYVIRNGATEAKRRYSEFEALREALVKLHPTLIIPPIPSKHTLSDYAAKQSKAKEDATIIARRRRMLQSFLRRCDNHPKLRDDEVLRKFLDGRYPWAEILNSPPLSHLPKTNLKAPAQNPADPHASPAYAALPLPSSVSSLKQPNQRFIDSEAFTNRFANHLSGSMEKVNRRLMRRWTEASGDYAELGAILNGFSLTESGQLATAIERTGQAADSIYISTGQMLRDWEEKFTEPLHEYTQFATILQKLLKWRHLKHLQYELAQDALEAKKMQMVELERIEAEAKRLDEALERGGAGLLTNGRVTGTGVDGSGIRDGVGSGFRPRSSTYGSAAETDGPSSESRSTSPTRDGSGEEFRQRSESLSSSASRPGPERSTSPSAVASKRASSSSRSSGYGLLGAITHTFHSVMDVDRDASRRNNIGKLREDINMLEEAVSLTANDLHFATTAIQMDLDRFQRQKVADFKQMTLEFAKMHREYCRLNLENWREAKAEIDNVERPAGMPESSLLRKQREDGGGIASRSRS